MTGFFTLVEREYYRFARLAGQTIAAPVITTFLFILIFGYSLGQQIREVSGFPYIIYILPGLAGMGVMTNAYSNSSTSLFMARIDRSIENILVAPLSHMKIVTAFVIGGVMRGVAVGVMTILVALVFTDLGVDHLLFFIFFMVGLSVVFSSFGVVAALWAEDWDHLATISNFVMTPFIYLGGVFYSISLLPPFWRKVSYINPMFYLVDGLRWSILGKGDLSPWLSGGVTIGLVLAGLLTAVRLFQKGYKLIV